MRRTATGWTSQTISDSGTGLSSIQNYSYDNDDRLTNVQDALSGQCATRSYTCDSDSNRTSLTAYAPNGDGSCQDSSGSTESTTYDSADRDTNTGYTYDTQGDITTTPSADTSGGGDLTATYYANDMLASQSQGGQSMTWDLDPTLGRDGSFTLGAVTYTNHYSDSGNSPTWVSLSDGSLLFAQYMSPMRRLASWARWSAMSAP